MSRKQIQPPEYWDRLFAPSSCLALISTADAAGRPNIATYGTCTRVCHDPVHIAFTTGLTKDTTKNVLATGEFVVNLPAFTREMMEKALVVAIPFDPGVSEFAKAGLTPIPSVAVKPPRIEECTRHFECKLEWTHEWSGRLMIVGRVVSASVDADCVDAQGRVFWDKVKPAHYCGGAYDNMFVPAYEAQAFDTPYEGPERPMSGSDRSHQEIAERQRRAGLNPESQA